MAEGVGRKGKGRGGKGPPLLFGQIEPCPRCSTSSYTLLCLIPPTAGFPWDNHRKILHGGKRMAMVQNGEEILARASTPHVGCTTVTDDRPTDLQLHILERNVITFG